MKDVKHFNILGIAQRCKEIFLQAYGKRIKDFNLLLSGLGDYSMTKVGRQLLEFQVMVGQSRRRRWNVRSQIEWIENGISSDGVCGRLPF